MKTILRGFREYVGDHVFFVLNHVPTAMRDALKGCGVVEVWYVTFYLQEFDEVVILGEGVRTTLPIDESDHLVRVGRSCFFRDFSHHTWKPTFLAQKLLSYSGWTIRLRW